MVLDIVPLVNLSIFGIFLIKNLKQWRSRVQPTVTLETGGTVLRRRDRDMMKMLFIELIIYIITTIANTIMHIYISTVDDVEKSKERQRIAACAVDIARTCLLYMSDTFLF
jgi:hypothetical protein